MKSLILLIVILFAVAGSSIMHKPVPKYAVCKVCGMKTETSEAYTFKYKGTKYYFDTYNCKETFRMNPDKFIYNVCDTTMKN